MQPALIQPLIDGRGEARPEIVICPYAGASQAAFRRWRALEPLSFRASLVTYPGRDARVHEPPLARIELLAARIAAELIERPPANPWILAGHSMGALVAFEVCRRLEALGVGPTGLVLSACHAPHERPRNPIGHLDDDDLIERLIQAGGAPVALRADPEFRALFLPMLRADFTASESYHLPLAGAVPLATRTLLLFGTLDRDALPDELRAWQPWLASCAGLRSVPGDHYYITQDPRAFSTAICDTFALAAPTSSNRATPNEFP